MRLLRTLERFLQRRWLADESDAHCNAYRWKHNQVQNKHNFPNNNQACKLVWCLIEQKRDAPGTHRAGVPAPRDLADALPNRYAPCHRGSSELPKDIGIELLKVVNSFFPPAMMAVFCAPNKSLSQLVLVGRAPLVLIWRHMMSSHGQACAPCIYLSIGANWMICIYLRQFCYSYKAEKKGECFTDD